MWWLSAFLVGFLGSFHCVGMCGPIAMALPLNRTSSHVLGGRIVYNSGRLLTYSTFGLLAGLFGHTLAAAGFQKTVAVGSGMAVMLFAILPLIFKSKFSPESLLYGCAGKIKTIFRSLFRTRSNLTLFLIGGVNGLLPCGFVYLALAGAATSATVLDGALYMFCFGLGTLPAMLSISMATTLFSPGLRKFFHRWTPYVAIAVAFF